MAFAKTLVFTSLLSITIPLFGQSAPQPSSAAGKPQTPAPNQITLPPVQMNMKLTPDTTMTQAQKEALNTQFKTDVSNATGIAGSRVKVVPIDKP